MDAPKRRPRMPHKWTHERLTTLIALCDRTRSCAEIAKEMGETLQAIRGQLKLLRRAGRLPREPVTRAQDFHSKLFTQEMDRLLVETYERGESLVDVVRLLGLTRKQVFHRMDYLRRHNRIGQRSQVTPESHKRLKCIAHMYESGMPIADIAKACNMSFGATGVALTRLRKKGIIGRRHKQARIPRE